MDPNMDGRPLSAALVRAHTLARTLPAIPFIDAREGGAVGLARERAPEARALRDECLTWFPPPFRRVLPAFDGLTRRWLVRSASPYAAEIEAIAGVLGFPGIWFLNGSYQWGCTTLAAAEHGQPWLCRTLDWPFPGLGRRVEVARMHGEAGEFLNVTWPGYVGTLTAVAQGRFAAAINQAPLWRRMRHPWLRPVDIALNAGRTWLRVRHIPPDQLLRQVFETARDFADARRRLESTPIARPVIYTLAGCTEGEICTIERTETHFRTRFEETCAANDWLVSAPPWEGRVASDLVLRCSMEEACANSHRRREALAGWRGRFTHEDFAWVAPPILNGCTRIAAELCAAEGRLRLVGYETSGGSELPEPVTAVFDTHAAPSADRTRHAGASV